MSVETRLKALPSRIQGENLYSHKDLVALLAHSKELGFTNYIISNGTLITESIAELLVPFLVEDLYKP